MLFYLQVCYYSQHYHCFVYSSERKKWIMYDDQTVKVTRFYHALHEFSSLGHIWYLEESLELGIPWHWIPLHFQGWSNAGFSLPTEHQEILVETYFSKDSFVLGEGDGTPIATHRRKFTAFPLLPIVDRGEIPCLSLEEIHHIIKRAMFFFFFFPLKTFNFMCPGYWFMGRCSYHVWKGTFAAPGSIFWSCKLAFDGQRLPFNG